MRRLLDLDGPAPTWPRPLDAAMELWARLPARARTAARAAAAVVVVVAAGGGLLRGPWGPDVDVLVVRSELAAGSPVTAEDVAVARRPAELVPPDAVTDPDALPVDAVSRGVVPAGTVLVQRQLASGGPAALTAAGTAAVPVPAEELPALPVGTRVDLSVTDLAGSTAVVARAATVVADDGSWRWLQVQREEVAEVAAGVRAGTLVTAVLPPAAPAAAP